MNKCTLFAMEMINFNSIPDNINHIEYSMGIVGQNVKNRQSWDDMNLKIMLNTIWYIVP